MAFRVKLISEAAQDVTDAFRWYDRQAPGPGGQFIEQLEKAFELAAENPTAFPLIRSGFRRVLTAKFPYAVYYAEGEDQITDFAVFHGSRDPLELRNRS